MTYQPDIVIYHDHCADGFGAAWACWMRWGNQCTYHAANYGQEPPDVSGKHVLIVDFSYKRDVLRAMGKTAKSIIVLDHHKTAEADLEEWAIEDHGDFWAGDDPLKLVRLNDDQIGEPIAALFDMNRSGAFLAWEFCHEEHAPMLIRLIQDRDLWRFTMPETKPFSLWLRFEPFSFERFDTINYRLEMGAAAIMTEARAMQRFFDAKVAEIAQMAWRKEICGRPAVVVNCPPMFASEVGHALLDRHPDAPFAGTFYETEKRTMWSLRSRDDREDVSVIASVFGGGGHRNAAGFSVSSEKGEQS